MATRRNANGAGEASVPPAPSASARETLDASVARLSGLNTDQLRLQWRNHLGGVAPAHLPGWLLLRVLAYRIQAAAFGDLDRATSTGTKPSSRGTLVPLQPADRRRARASGSNPELCWSANGTAVSSGS